MLTWCFSLSHFKYSRAYSDILNHNSISLIAFVTQSESFVRTAIYKYTSKWMPIICLLLRTNFNICVVTEDYRCVVSSLNRMVALRFCSNHVSSLVLSPLSLCCLSTQVSSDFCASCPTSCINSSNCVFRSVLSLILIETMRRCLNIQVWSGLHKMYIMPMF